MAEWDEREFVGAIAERAVRRMAPEELAFFDATRELYLRDPDRALAGRRRTDEMLGSGVDIVVNLVSPVALAVAAAVYQQLTDKAGEAVVERGGRLLRRVFRRRERLSDTTVATPLDEEQMAAVREVAQRRARALGLPEDKVELLVDAIVAGLRDDG